MVRKFIYTLTLMCVAAVAAEAQKFVEKPYSAWTVDQAKEILSNSGWAKTYQNLSAAAGSDMREAARAQSDTRLSGQERSRSERSGGTAPVYATLRSALPVRQALVRLNQIASGYDKMDEKNKAKFDESMKGLLGCAICQTHYVITMSQASNSTGQFVEEGLFQGMTLAQMKDNIWLETDDGKRRSLVEFTAPTKRGDSAIFFFARKDEQGNVFVTDSTKEVSIVFNNTFFTPSNRSSAYVPRRFDFKVSKLKVGSELMF